MDTYRQGNEINQQHQQPPAIKNNREHPTAGGATSVNVDVDYGFECQCGIQVLNVNVGYGLNARNEENAEDDDKGDVG